MSKKQQLAKVFEYAKSKGVAIRFGDLMRQGFHPATIKNQIKEEKAVLDYDAEGYSIVLWRAVEGNSKSQVS